MTLAQSMGRYFRLKQELSIVYAARPRHGSLIGRLANELATTEREIAQRQVAA